MGKKKKNKASINDIKRSLIRKDQERGGEGEDIDKEYIHFGLVCFKARSDFKRKERELAERGA